MVHFYIYPCTQITWPLVIDRGGREKVVDYYRDEAAGAAMMNVQPSPLFRVRNELKEWRDVSTAAYARPSVTSDMILDRIR